MQDTVIASETPRTLHFAPLPAIPKPFPPEIAISILAVTKSVGMVAKAAYNEHGRYKFASVDAFLAVTNPACSEAGLIVQPVLLKYEQDIIESTDAQGREKKRRILKFTYMMRLIHESGAIYEDDRNLRPIWIDYTGPQSFQIAESYVLKAFQRGLFQIATGDPEADDFAQHSAEIIRADVRAGKKRRETGVDHVSVDFGQGLEEIPTTEIQKRVTQHIAEIGTIADGRAWWNANLAARESLHTIAPRISMDLKRAVEAQFDAMAQTALNVALDEPPTATLTPVKTRGGPAQIHPTS